MSSENYYQRGLDTMLIAYSLLDDHPATGICEQFVREREGWFVTAFNLLEAKTILEKVYGLEPSVVTQKVIEYIEAYVQVVTLNAEDMLDALSLADTYRIDLMDATLLQAALIVNVKFFATDDAKLAKVCASLSLAVENPIDDALRQAITAWEDANLPQKGLPRILRSVHRWLKQTDAEAAENFWSQTGAGSHLP